MRGRLWNDGTSAPNRYDKWMFRSLTDFYLEADDHHTKNAEFADQEDESFSGTRRYADARNLALKGWKEGLAQSKRWGAFLESAIATARAQREEPVYDVIDGDWDVSRLLTGEPEACMRLQETEDPDQKFGKGTLHLVVNPCVSGMISKSRIILRGLAPMALVDCLEAFGYSLDVTLAHVGTQSGTGKMLIQTPIKRAGDYMQPDTLIYALGHPSLLRRHLFSLIPECGETGKASAKRGGLGTPSDLDEHELAAMHADIYIPKMHGGEGQWGSDASAQAWIIEQLAIYGLKVTAPKP